MKKIFLHTSMLTRKQWYTLISVLAGLMFLLLTILVITFSTGLYLNFSSFIQIHKTHPEVFILYLLPLLFPFIVHYSFIRTQKERNDFQDIINRKDETINRNAAFAKEIGEGNYSVHIIPEGDQDILGKSLLVMKENLLANRPTHLPYGPRRKSSDLLPAQDKAGFQTDLG